MLSHTITLIIAVDSTSVVMLSIILYIMSGILLFGWLVLFSCTFMCMCFVKYLDLVTELYKVNSL